jgi:hypothetical protein
VPVTGGSNYSVVVGTGSAGFVNISWNPQ